MTFLNHISPWRAQTLVATTEQTFNRYTYLYAYDLPKIDSTVDKISRYSAYSTLDLRNEHH